MKKCPFCGSEQMVQDTPYIELKENGQYEPATRYCCKAQAMNRRYQSKHFSKLDDIDNTPDIEEASEW